MLKQELKDKELIFSKLQTLERENERLSNKVILLRSVFLNRKKIDE